VLNCLSFTVDSAKLADSNHSSSQHEQKTQKKKNKNLHEGKKHSMDSSDQNNNSIKEDTIVSETKPSSPHDDNSVIGSAVPSHASKTSKTSSKTCCLL
jgi:hypothetical protein